ncbi:hypothetical protein [Caulobacter vibrioides]|uniref:hypothetical protein n=1 Tax=Caulobacter vibrioides TaxID=155892 RepID=UPI000BB459F7|nr:hypothetical protein [Caulobacter vibrioides]ATC26486.1 hypothetical protein CA608_19105 [Caulobacter vibrioides]PLR12308.1 hypothetical protein CVUC_08735 [Caulobacter vibrioides]
MIKSIKKETKGKAGRKASGLRDLSPEAARLAISRAALKAIETPLPADMSAAAQQARRAEIARVGLKREANLVRGAVALQQTAIKATGMSGGVPTLERLLREDVSIASLQTVEDGEFAIRPVMRSKTMQEVLVGCGVERAVAWAGEEFIADVERATIGRLTASYGEGLGGAATAEPLRVLQALDRLGRAQERLTRKERVAVWGFLVLGMSATDVGWALVGNALAKSKGGERDMRTATALVVEAALERMAVFYKSVA